MTAKVPKLFHFTCGHGFESIGRRGVLRPQVTHPTLGCQVVWLTDDPAASRDDLGFDAVESCDRMLFRYVASDVGACRRWLGSPERASAPVRAVAELESAGRPECWWVSDWVAVRLG